MEELLPEELLPKELLTRRVLFDGQSEEIGVVLWEAVITVELPFRPQILGLEPWEYQHPSGYGREAPHATPYEKPSAGFDNARKMTPVG